MKTKKRKKRVSIAKALRTVIEQAIAGGRFDGKHKWTR